MRRIGLCRLIERTVWTALLVCTSLDDARAAVLRVPSDYATLIDASFAALPGDSILVAPGTYTASAVRAYDFWNVQACAFVRGGVKVVAESGPEATFLEIPNPDPNFVVATIAVVPGSVAETRIEGFTLRGRGGFGRGLFARWAQNLHLVNCRIENFRDVSGAGVFVYESRFTMSQCEIRNCIATESPGGVYIDNHDAIPPGPSLFEHCLFESCSGGTLLVSSYRGDLCEIRECEFLQNEGGAWIDARAALFDNRFEGNVVNAEWTVRVRYGGEARRNVFVNNHALGSGGAGLYLIGGTCEENTFYGCTAEYFPAAAVYIGTDYPLTHALFAHNIVAGSRGITAVVLNPDLQDVIEGSCNIFWDNAAGDLGGGSLDDFGFVVDPQFCDAPNAVLTLQASSPCLAANSSACGAIGSLGEGCPARGVVIATDPPWLDVEVDGQVGTAPLYREWPVGDPHSIAAPSPQPALDAERWSFSTWSDGGAIAHEIASPPPGTSILATFVREFQLVMSASAGGTVTPPGISWYAAGTPVPIAALPTPPYWFVRWQGSGSGGYSGRDAEATVTMNGPLTETASFSRYVDVTLTSNRADTRARVDGTEFELPEVFSWEQFSNHTVEVDSVVQTAPGTMVLFTGWSDGVSAAHRTLNAQSGITVGAGFVTRYLLTMVAGPGGHVTPTSGWFAPGTVVPIAAVAHGDSLFVSWVGQGNGSYTGESASSAVTLLEPVTQTATFRSPGTRVALSLSATDADSASGPPLGVGQVYLWLVCSEGLPIGGFEGRAEGTMTVAGFVPAPGVINGGSLTDLQLVRTNCSPGPALLGSFFVLDPSGGTICLAPSTTTGRLACLDCSAGDYAWPGRLAVSGVATDASTVCASGVGCDGAAALPVLTMTARVLDRAVELRSPGIDGATLLAERRDPGAADFVPLPSDGLRSEAPEFVFLDERVRPLMLYVYRLRAEHSRGDLLSPEVSVETPDWHPSPTGFVAVAPNPFRTTTKLAYSLAAPGTVDFRVFDVAGRLVRHLLRETRPAGPHVASWDARDDAGRAVPAGVYFVRFSTAGASEVRKVVSLDR